MVALRFILRSAAFSLKGIAANTKEHRAGRLVGQLGRSNSVIQIFQKLFHHRSEQAATRAALAWINRHDGLYGSVADWLNERARLAYHERGW